MYYYLCLPLQSKTWQTGTRDSPHPLQGHYPTRADLNTTLLTPQHQEPQQRQFLNSQHISTRQDRALEELGVRQLNEWDALSQCDTRTQLNIKPDTGERGRKPECGHELQRALRSRTRGARGGSKHGLSAAGTHSHSRHQARTQRLQCQGAGG